MKSNAYNDVVERYTSIQSLIVQTKAQSPAANEHIMCLAVTKQQPVEKINRLIECGHRFFAENKLQEAASRWPALKQAYPDCELHMIGGLQTNKVKEAIELFDVIQTVDRKKLIDTIEKYAGQVGKVQRCLVQVNIGEEPQKGGVMPDELEALLAYSANIEHVLIEGLMCIPPADEAPAPYFALMRKLKERYQLPFLSMGMSGDFQTAIRFGATHIRVGTALLGERGG